MIVVTKRDLKMPPSEARKRTYRLAILGPSTARCEKCLADCTSTVGEWSVTGLCPTCSTTKGKQQGVAGR